MLGLQAQHGTPEGVRHVGVRHVGAPHISSPFPNFAGSEVDLDQVVSLGLDVADADLRRQVLRRIGERDRRG